MLIFLNKIAESIIGEVTLFGFTEPALSNQKTKNAFYKRAMSNVFVFPICVSLTNLI